MEWRGPSLTKREQRLPNDDERPHSIADQFTDTYIQYQPLNTNKSIKTPLNHTKQDATDSRALDLEREYTAEYHTPQRTRFFDAFHAKPPDQSINAFVKEHKHQE